MSVFGNYSRYYDLLYKDKDYAGEAKYIAGLIKKNAPGAKTILELGCGTGKHAALLAAKGYAVTGVDRSAKMLASARKRIKEMQGLQVEFIRGDIRTTRLQKKHDAVISLFHVMSYLTSNKDLQDAFATAAIHLKKGGIFVFDCWYGPAVLTDRPVVRVKRLEDDKIEVTRKAVPRMHPNDNVVDVNYSIAIKDKMTGAVDTLKESHKMRYLFKPEIEQMLSAERMELLGCEEWMTGHDLGFDSWGSCFITRKI